jgi:hypothetical protein
MESKKTIKLNVIGGTGSGKTHLAATFPKSMWAITEPGCEDTFQYNKDLSKNVLEIKHFMPTSPLDTKRVFEELDAYCELAREKALKGEIDTFVLDNFTYLIENKWIHINQYSPTYSPKNGELDTRGMYGQLSRWAYQFVLMKLLTLPCHLVVNCHEKLESDEAMEKKPDKNSPVVASVLGGFRDDMPGMFSYVFFLAKLDAGQGKYKYMARTNMGNGRMAKNRIGLPSVIENISYQTIAEAIAKAVGEAK